MSGEFEDREKHLGELPPVIQRERRENYTPRDVVGVRSMPLDIAANARSLGEQRGAPIGTPAIPAHTTTTFDARPINGRDWVQHKYLGIYVYGGSFESDVTGSISRTVPGGYTAILRSVRISMLMPYELRELPEWVTALEAVGDITTNIVTYHPSYKLLVNNIVVPNYDKMIYSPDERAVETFVMASENQDISIEILFTAQFRSAMASFVTDPNMPLIPCRVEMYGNEVLTRGLSLPYEITSQVGQAK